MTSSKRIEMHFTEILHLAEQLHKLADQMKATAENEMMQIICENKACWKSECADILIEKEVKISAGLAAEADKLNATAQEMERQAKRMYQSERINNQLAVTRIY